MTNILFENIPFTRRTVLRCSCACHCLLITMPHNINHGSVNFPLIETHHNTPKLAISNNFVSDYPISTSCAFAWPNLLQSFCCCLALERIHNIPCVTPLVQNTKLCVTDLLCVYKCALLNDAIYHSK